MKNISLEKVSLWIGILSLWTFLFLLSNGAFAQTWQNVGNGLQQKVIGVDTSYRFVKTPGSGLPFAITEQLKKKQNTFVMNVADFGAKGDGVTDNTTILRGLFNLAASEGAVIFFPSGNYLVSDSIIIKYPSVIRGANNSVITQTSADKTLFFCDANQVTFSNLTLNNSSTTVTAGTGIVWNKSDQSQIDAVFIKHFYKNVDILNGSSWLITNSVFLDPVKYNIKIQDIAHPDAGDAFISNCFFWAGKYAGATHVYQKSGGGLKLINNKFNATTINYPDYHIDCEIVGNTSILLAQNNSFEGFSISGVRVRSTSGITFNNITVSNNQFSSYTATAKTFIDVNANGGSVANVSIQGNDLLASATSKALIAVDGIANVSVAGNVSNIANIDSITNCTNVTYNVSGTVKAGNLEVLGRNSNPYVSVKNSGTTGFPLIQLDDDKAGGKFYNIENGRTLGRYAVYDNTGDVFYIENGNSFFSISVPEYADNAAAVTGGLAVGKMYRTGDLLKVVH